MSVDAERISFDHIIGDVLANRYLIESRLGEGGMGAVYRAKHVKVGRPFAVKVLHPRFLEDRKVLQRFEREAELAGRLRHPNVIAVVDVGETADGMRYMVMDFAEGPDLAALIAQAPFPPERIHLTRQMLEGLFHAHEAGLVHRDFKPENVIIERDTHGAEVVRIVDFGIAILREGGDSTESPGRLTTNGLVLGTPHYMAPEQAIADPLDHRVDLFALGIMIYEMLCGKLPFDGNGVEVARANLILDPPPISQRVPLLEVDPLLEAFARKLMQKKRDDRPANAKAARELLDVIAHDRPAAAKALGVSLATREPQVTQDVAPPRRDTGTVPPPAKTPVDEPRPISTANAPVKKSKAPMIAAVVVGLGIAGAASAIVLGGKDEAKPTAEQPIAAAQPTEAAKPPTPPEPKPQELKPSEPPNPAPTNVAPAPVAEPTPREEVKPAETPPPSPAAKPAKAKSKAKTAETKPMETKVAETKPTETKVAETKPAEAKPAEPKQPQQATAKSLEAQFSSIYAQLRQLETEKGVDAANPLKGRVRQFKIYEYVGTQAKLDAGSAILRQLANDIAAARKR